MIRPSDEVVVYLCVQPVDFRKQAATLALVVEQALGRDAFANAVYGFTNRAKDRVKLLTWERNGYVLWTKRVEGRDRFVWPSANTTSIAMTGRELNALLDGFDVFARPHRPLSLARVG